MFKTTSPETDPNNLMPSNKAQRLAAFKRIASEADELWSESTPADMFRRYYETFRPETVLSLIEMAETSDTETNLSTVIAEQRGASKALTRIQELSLDKTLTLHEVLSKVSQELNPVPIPVPQPRH